MKIIGRLSVFIFTTLFISSMAMAEGITTSPSVTDGDAMATTTAVDDTTPAETTATTDGEVLVAANTTAETTTSADEEAAGNKLSEKLADTAVVVNVEIDSCNADAAIFCPGLPLNSKKSFACLMAYEDNLSLACKVGIVEAAFAVEMSMLALEYSIDACEADADKYCLDVEPGEGRIVSCLKKNESNLKKECTTALKETGLWAIGTK